MNTPLELLNRLEVLERKVGDQETALNEQVAAIQTLQEGTPTPAASIHSNLIRNGEFDISRNAYLYFIDVTDTSGEDADVSSECFSWYVSEPDTSAESTGSITALDNTLILDTEDFIGDDADVEIVVEGAGTAGDDLVTTVATFTDSTHVELTDAAVTTVSGARVRWRLLRLLDDATDDDLDADPATNTTLKDENHTLYDTTLNDPDWDSENGWVRIGSDKWLCQPLKQNLIRPSLQYIASFIYKLGEEIDGLTKHHADVFIGIWDNSPGQRKFLEGAAIEITAEVVGSPSGTTETTYFLVFHTNWGASIGSEQVTIDAPANFSDTEYVALSWNNPVGTIRTEIYRKRSDVVANLNPPYPANSYKDKGATRGVPSEEFPSVTRTRAIAYMETNHFNFEAATTLRWIKDRQFNIPIPADYDAAKTTDKQWFVIGLKEAISDAEEVDVPRSIFIDRVSLSDKPGEFARSAWDSEAVRQITSLPHSGDIGGLGGGVFGGGSVDPGGTNFCPTFDMPIEVEENGVRKEVRAVELIDSEHLYKVVNRNGEAVEYTATPSPYPQVCYKMTAAGRKLTASEDEPVFIDEAGNTILLRNIKNKTIILAKEGLVTVESCLRLLRKRHTVKISLKGQEKGFWCNSFAVHNFKPSEFIAN